jgi:hypothetical protein
MEATTAMAQQEPAIYADALVKEKRDTICGEL